MSTIIDEIKSLQATKHPQQESFWAYQSVIDMINNYRKFESVEDVRREAIRLIEYFTSYGIDVSPERRREYAVFSALQYITLITTPEMEVEKLVFYISVAGEISKRSKNPN